MSDRGRASPPPEGPITLREAIAHVQDQIAAALSVDPARRAELLRGILVGFAARSAGYWLHLTLSMSLSSLGLALGSTAVVIGAMLISPLMDPLVHLSMGLTVGSPLITIRSFVRTLVSVVYVIAGSALLTRALPFHEVTSEIASRITPTALDLFIAMFCAIAAAYTIVRPGSETASTAAGTAVGIALVPPLCVVGYGLGTSSMSIATGAALLFTANLCAILLVAALFFLLLGFNRVRMRPMEHEVLEHQDKGGIGVRTARTLEYVFSSRFGPVLRVLMPLVLLGVVYVPLRRALAEVAWEIGVREGIRQILPERTVRSVVTVERHRVSVRLVTIGQSDQAAHMERDLKERIAAISGTTPQIEIITVPDAQTLESSTAALAQMQHAAREIDQRPAVALLLERMEGALKKRWPREAAGALLASRLEFPEAAPPLLVLVHLGAPIGEAGAQLLAQMVSADLGAPVRVRDAAFPPVLAPHGAGGGHPPLPALLIALDFLRQTDRTFVCGHFAAEPRGGAGPEATWILATLRDDPHAVGGRVQVELGAAWDLRLSAEPCAAAPPAAPATPRSP